jgi:hypothetical protein
MVVESSRALNRRRQRRSPIATGCDDWRYRRMLVSDADESADSPELPGVVEALPSDHERPKWAPLTVVAWIGLVVCTNIAAGVWAKWVNTDPELLLALSSRNRYLALTLVAGVSVPAYVVIATLRISVAFVVCHLIGYAYAHQATGWLKRYAGFSDEAEAAFDRGFERAEWALIPFFAGSNIVAVLTGIRRTPPGKLALLLAIGVAGRLALMWWLARTFEDQLADFLEVVARYQWWFVIASVALVVLINAKNLRRR